MTDREPEICCCKSPAGAYMARIGRFRGRRNLPQRKGLATTALPNGGGRGLPAPAHVPPGVGGSSNGRTADSDSACLGSNPSPPANSQRYYGASGGALEMTLRQRRKSNSCAEIPLFLGIKPHAAIIFQVLGTPELHGSTVLAWIARAGGMIPCCLINTRVFSSVTS